jgi:hypothetical protein
MIGSERKLLSKSCFWIKFVSSTPITTSSPNNNLKSIFQESQKHPCYACINHFPLPSSNKNTPHNIVKSPHPKVR